MRATPIWPQKPQVYQLIKDCVEKVNADLSADALLAGSQVSRFLVLHKELDADDGELTRTNKVRRGFIADKYAGAGGRAVRRRKTSQFIETAGQVRGRAHRQRQRHAAASTTPRPCAAVG